MIRHIVMFNFREGFTPEENRQNAQQVKARLEGLKSVIPGIVEFDVIIDALPTSNKDVVLNTLFVSVDALAAYQVHPAHEEVSKFVGSVMRNRACIDYYE